MKISASNFKPINIMLKAITVLLVMTFYINIASANYDDDEVVSNANSWQTKIIKSIQKEKFTKAIVQLKKVNKTDSADWHNLLGFSMHEQKEPDFDKAQYHYEKALSIDPKHKGALEYFGELKLKMNDIAGARELLERLEKVCPAGCDEQKELAILIKKAEA